MTMLPQRGDLFERGLNERQAGHLSFVRWSLDAGYAQFHEWITSDAPVAQTAEHEVLLMASGGRGGVHAVSCAEPLTGSGGLLIGP
jgi:hypothetical protein